MGSIPWLKAVRKSKGKIWLQPVELEELDRFILALKTGKFGGAKLRERQAGIFLS